MDLSLGDAAVSIARDLIRFDTTNWGEGRARGEDDAAQYVATFLERLDLRPQLFRSEARRTSVVARLEGANPQRPALVLHGHLDVVPADPAEWSADPFGAEIRDGEIWGRGAVDMKDMDGMILAVIQDWHRRGIQPPRPIVLCFFADEEAGGRLGSHWLVDNHPELFAGAEVAVSEVGGYSVTVAGQRAYLIQTAEKGIAWLRLVARGTAGHGSALNLDNAVEHLVEALIRIADQRWPVRLIPTTRALLQGVAELVGLDADLDQPEVVNQLIDALGPTKRFVQPSTCTALNLTGLEAGVKVNQVPGKASGTVDLRPLPGDEESALAEVKRLAGPQIEVQPINLDRALEAPLEGPLVEAMRAALAEADPGAPALPYMLTGGTDGKALSRLGITSYGFAPLKLPEGFDFTAMFHGVDERVPVDSVRWGAAVLADFLERS
ncbi:MAG: M20/M25/M40 family metallo-hydrolase [Bifidobacteriaceae bacterium]|jgi:acetylornithine deacetylase/succinyl-diaminopimelate desuccinylase-like protein|nr:M20/M25/M40 family metallo-hydrolase [Bifidobacteriaceae bacterium]